LKKQADRKKYIITLMGTLSLCPSYMIPPKGATHVEERGKRMTTIVSQGESYRRAVKWVDSEKQDGTVKTLLQLIDEAGMRFNLSPKESDALLRFFRGA
jgi:hypothetical protein